MPPTDPLQAPPLRRRMACWLYEGMLLFGVVFTAGLVFSIATQMRSGADERLVGFQAFLFVVFGLYCVTFWTRGQTLAMRTWRIRIVDRHGRRVPQGRAWIRYLYAWIWFLPPLAAFQSRHFAVWQVGVVFAAWVAIWAILSRFHPQGQFWHDAWAGTRLVEDSAPS